MTIDHFPIIEFACKDGTAYPARRIDDGTWHRLKSTCNVVRHAYGQAIGVISGYRTQIYNAKVGGAPLSQHVQGAAADLRPSGLPKKIKDWTAAHYAQVADLHALVLDLREQGKLPYLGGLGEYPTFIHLDVRRRADGTIARWKDKSLK